MQHADLTKKADALAQDKRQWEESMKTGLLVERSQITLEMQRLASGLVEEERRRGSAEERRRKVEDEVDELAASLFDQVSRLYVTRWSVQRQLLGTDPCPSSIRLSSQKGLMFRQTPWWHRNDMAVSKRKNA